MLEERQLQAEERHRQILELFDQGKHTGEISQLLGLTGKTIARHAGGNCQCGSAFLAGPPIDRLGRVHHNQIPETVQEVHRRAVDLRALGWKLEAIGRALGRNHSTVMSHLNGRCKCNLYELYQQSRGPRL